MAVYPADMAISPLPATPTVSPRQAERPLVLALDIGTSSTRAIVYDARLRPVTGLDARSGYEPRAGDDGASVLDVRTLLDAAYTALDEVHAALGATNTEVAAVALDALAYAGCGTDAAGRPLTPFYLWS